MSNAMLWVLAQADFDYSTPPSGLRGLLALFDGLPLMLYFPLVIWMAVYCVRRDTDSRFWLWIILIVPFGAVVYFFVRWLPSTQFTAPAFLQKYLRGNDLRKLEIAASQIGNAHQFVEWGDLLREVGKWSQAGDAYQKALKKDPKSLPALWGSAQVDFRNKDFTASRDKLRQILDQDFTYKFGDISLTYAKSLYELGDIDSAKQHLEEHARKWRHPEALYLLASILLDRGHAGTARSYLQSMIHDIEASPRAIARRFFFWKGRAKRLLRKTR